MRKTFKSQRSAIAAAKAVVDEKAVARNDRGYAAIVKAAKAAKATAGAPRVVHVFMANGEVAPTPHGGSISERRQRLIKLARAKQDERVSTSQYANARSF